MNTILLGGSGFLGPELLEHYPGIVAIGRTKPKANARFIECPTLDQLPHALGQVDFDKVIMMIGSSNHHELNASDSLAFEKNVLPLKKVFATLRKHKIKKMITFTTILLYDRNRMILPVDENQSISPLQNEYIFSKYIAEQLADYYSDIPNIVARLTNIYGPTQALGRPDIVNQLVEGLVIRKKAKVLNVAPKRDFIYTADVAEAVMRLLQSDFTGRINLATGVMHSILEIVELLEELSGIQIERLNGEATGHLEFRADISLLKKVTNWMPRYSFAAGLTETYHKMEQMYG